MPTYTITGPFKVLDQEPGTTLTEKQLVDCDVDWLIESGHIAAAGAEATTSEAAPAEAITEADPADKNKEG